MKKETIRVATIYGSKQSTGSDCWIVFDKEKKYSCSIRMEVIEYSSIVVHGIVASGDLEKQLDLAKPRDGEVVLNTIYL